MPKVEVACYNCKKRLVCGARKIVVQAGEQLQEDYPLACKDQLDDNLEIIMAEYCNFYEEDPNG